MRSSNKNLPSTVDNAIGSNDICNVFCNKYNDLNNSVSYSKNIMTHINKTSTVKLKKTVNLLTVDKHNVNVDDVLTSMKCLNHGKYDGDTGQCSDHLTNGTHKLYVCLSFLYKTMLIHRYIPSTLLLSTVIPIPKKGARWCSG